MRRCEYCGVAASIDHLCDDPGQSPHGESYTTLVTVGIYRTPEGEYLVTPERIADVLGADAAKALVDACLDEERSTADDTLRHKGEHKLACYRLRRAANHLRAVAAMRRSAEQMEAANG